MEKYIKSSYSGRMAHGAGCCLVKNKISATCYNVFITDTFSGGYFELHLLTGDEKEQIIKHYSQYKTFEIKTEAVLCDLWS